MSDVEIIAKVKSALKESASWPERLWGWLPHAATWFTWILAITPLRIEYAAVATLALPLLFWAVRRRSEGPGRISFSGAQAQEALLFQLLLVASFFSIAYMRGFEDRFWWVFTLGGIGTLQLFNFLLVSFVVLGLGKPFAYPLSPFSMLRRRGLSAEQMRELTEQLQTKSSRELYQSTIEKLNTTQQSVLDHANRFSKLTYNAPDRRGLELIEKKSRQLVRTIQAVEERLVRDPVDLGMHRSFLSYYPDATLDILNRYAELRRHPELQLAEEDYPERIAESLDSLNSAYQKFHAGLLKNDLLQLDTEMAVVRRTMELDGMERAYQSQSGSEEAGSATTKGE